MTAATVDPTDSWTVSDHRLVEHARDFATAMHHGQVDKNGDPYITHPERVAARALEKGYGAREVAIAWLHDVLEDCPVEVVDLVALGFPMEVVTACHLLDRTGLTPEAYYARIRANLLARRVKLLDIDDNTDPARLARLDPGTRARLTAKYAHARSLLGAS